MKDNNLKSFFLLNKIIAILLVSIYVFTMGVLSIYVYINRTIENTVINYPPCITCNYGSKYANPPQINYKIPVIIGLASNDPDEFSKPLNNYRYNNFQFSDFIKFYIVSTSVLLAISVFTIFSYKKMYLKLKNSYYFRILSIFSGLLSVIIPFFTVFYLRELIEIFIRFYIPDYIAYIFTGIISMILILLETILIIMVLRKEVRKYYFDSI